MTKRLSKPVTPEQRRAIEELHSRSNTVTQICRVTKISRTLVTNVVDEIMTPQDSIKIESAKKRLKKLTDTAGKAIFKKAIEGGAQVIRQKVLDKAFMAKFSDLQSKTEKLLEEANTNHETALQIAGKLLGDLNLIVTNPDKKLSIQDIERAMKVLESSANTMSILFDNIGVDLRSEITNKRMTVLNKNLTGPPMFSFINSKGIVVDVITKDKKDD